MSKIAENDVNTLESPKEIAASVTVILLAILFMATVSQQAAASTVEVTVTGKNQAKPGDLITNVFTVQNTGSTADTYDLNLKTPSGWTSLGSVPGEVNLDPGKSKKLFVTVIVPQTAVAKQYTISFKASSQSVTGDEDTGQNEVVVSEIPGVKIEWLREPPRTEPGGSATGIFTLTNTGNVSDTYTMEVDTNNCKVSLEKEQVQVFPGDRQRVELTMQVPPSLSPGAEYSFYLEISSRQHPGVTDRLRHSSSAAPPPPEEVGGTIFPLWPVTTAISGSEDGDFSIDISGSGELGDIGSLSASTSLSPSSIQEPTGSFVGDRWGINLSGGGVSGGFGSVSSNETAVTLFGDAGENVSTQLLFGKDVLGFSGRGSWESGSLRVVGGIEDDTNYQFDEVQISQDFPGPFSVTAGVGSISTQTESGSVFAVNPALSGDTVSMTGNFRYISPSFPDRTEEKHYGLTLTFSGEIPLGLSTTISRVKQSPGAGEYALTTRGFNVDTALPITEGIDLDLAAEFENEKSNDDPVSTDASNWLIEGGISGTFAGENDFSLGLAFDESSNRITGESFMETEATGTVGLNLEPLEVELSLDILEVINKNTGEVESSNTNFSTGVSFPTIKDVIDLSLSINDTASMTFGFSRPIRETGEFSGSFQVPFSQEGTFSISLTATTPTVFDFFGPTKGRVKGKAFIDENGDGSYDPGEPPVEDLLLTLTEIVEREENQDTLNVQPAQEQAITGENGDYAFWPVESGKYKLHASEIPFGLESRDGFPMTLNIKRGKFNTPLAFNRYSSISGIVFRDRNQNKKMEANEERIPDAEVLISGPSGTMRKKTGPSGRFIARVEPGEYTVNLVQSSLPERFVPTTPGEITFNVKPQQSRELKFGTYQEPKEVVFTFGPPKARFKYSPQKPVTGQDVRFDASDSEGVGDEIASYLWKFEGPEGSFTAQGEKVEVSFPNPGEWQISLTVEDESNMKDRKEVTVQVTE